MGICAEEAKNQSVLYRNPSVSAYAEPAPFTQGLSLIHISRGDNIYIPELRSDALGERDGARLRALRRAEARHRDADYIFFRHLGRT